MKRLAPGLVALGLFALVVAFAALIFQKTSSATRPSGEPSQPSPSDSHQPPANIERLASPAPLGPGGDTNGQPVEVDPPPSSLQPTTSGLDAVNIAWLNVGDLGVDSPSSVTASFGSLSGHPTWLVRFDGVCFSLDNPSPSDTCAPSVTVVVDDETGSYVEEFW